MAWQSPYLQDPHHPMFPVWSQFHESMSWRFPDQLGGGQESHKKCQEARQGGQEVWSGGQEAWQGGQEMHTEPEQPPAIQSHLCFNITEKGQIIVLDWYNRILDYTK